MSGHDFIYIIVAPLLFRFVFVGLIQATITDYLQRLLIRWTRYAIIFWHARQRAARRGHQIKNYIECQDQRCKEVLK